MYNTGLREKIRAGGHKMGFVARQLGLSNAGFWRKVRGDSDFTCGEAEKLAEILSLSGEERDNLFLCAMLDTV